MVKTLPPVRFLLPLVTLKRCMMVGFLLFVGIVTYAIHVLFIQYSRARLMDRQVTLCNRCRQSPIPRIVHNTWIDKNVPAKWHETWTSCLQKHNESEHRLWTDEEMEAFLLQEYPWFVPVYRSYAYPIQRADSFRYFVLYHFGGVYLDLDVGCSVSVHDIMANLSGYNVLLMETEPSGVTNCIQAATPRHPLYKLAISRLLGTSWWHGLPYLDIMFAAGPTFLTGTLSLHHNHDVYIVPKATKLKYFKFGIGYTWHQWDAQFFMALGNLPVKLACKIAAPIVSLLILSLTAMRYRNARVVDVCSSCG